MKKLLILFSIFTALTLAQTAFSQPKWKTYNNARYGYSIVYPSNLLLPKGESDNGDGQIFLNNTAEMRVFASNMLLNETLTKEFKAVVRKSENVSYKTINKNFFVVSGKIDGRIFYQKTIARADGVFLTFYIEYVEDERNDYDKFTTRIVGSIK
jgi:hypothetical protein